MFLDFDGKYNEKTEKGCQNKFNFLWQNFCIQKKSKTTKNKNKYLVIDCWDGNGGIDPEGWEFGDFFLFANRGIFITVAGTDFKDSSEFIGEFIKIISKFLRFTIFVRKALKKEI